MENHPLLTRDIDETRAELRRVAVWGIAARTDLMQTRELCSKAELAIDYLQDQLRQARERIATLTSERETILNGDEFACCTDGEYACTGACNLPAMLKRQAT
jgi:outer membrane protein TolC